jgi:outer membrane protein assembly factor BamD (BamD/ComL family)
MDDGSGVPQVFPDITSSGIYKQPVQDLVEVIVFGVRGTAKMRYGDIIDENEMVEVLQFILTKFGKMDINKEEVYLAVKNSYKVIKYDAEQRDINYDIHIKKLKSITFPSVLYTTIGSVYEKNNPKIAIEGYKLLIRKYPDSPYKAMALEKSKKLLSKLD